MESSSQAQSYLTNAQNVIQELERAHLNELRCLRCPIEVVKLIFEAACVILGETNIVEWRDIIIFISDINLKQKASDFRVGMALRPENMTKLSQLLNQPSVSLENARRASQGAFIVLKWVLEMKKFFEASQ